MTTDKKTTTESGDGKIVEEPEWGLALALSVHAKGLRAYAQKQEDRPRRRRFERAARIALALSGVLFEKADESLAEFDKLAKAFLKRQSRGGTEVSWVTDDAIDRDGELIRRCARILAVFGDGADALDALNLTLRRMGFAREMDGGEVARRLDAISFSVEMTPSALARTALTALGWTRDELKNFGAGLAPNGSRKR